jgi:hypothetical protein
VDARFVHDGLNDEQLNKWMHSVIKLFVRVHAAVLGLDFHKNGKYKIIKCVDDGWNVSTTTVSHTIE